MADATESQFAEGEEKQRTNKGRISVEQAYALTFFDKKSGGLYLNIDAAKEAIVAAEAEQAKFAKLNEQKKASKKERTSLKRELEDLRAKNKALEQAARARSASRSRRSGSKGKKGTEKGNEEPMED